MAQLLADASGLPVETMAEEEAGLRGAARLAASALAGGAGTSASDASAPGALPDWPLPVRERRAPRWDASRRAAARARWLAFAGSATAVLPPSETP